MNQNAGEWNKEEFLAYLLIYCMHIDSEELDSEKDFIRSRVGNELYDRAYECFSTNNDYQSLTKIQESYKTLNFNSDDKAQLISEIEQVFGSDGKFHAFERSVGVALNRILS